MCTEMDESFTDLLSILSVCNFSVSFVVTASSWYAIQSVKTGFTGNALL